MSDNVRLATSDDIPMLLTLGFQFLRQTPYRYVQADTERARTWLEYVLDTGVVIVADEDSFICGVTMQLPFASDTVASELMWGSVKEGRDRARTEIQLLEAFEYWCRNVAKADAIQIGSFHGDKFLKARGYERCETLYFARLT